VIRKLGAEPAVLSYEEETLVELHPLAFAPPDPRFPDQWHLENVGQGGGLPFSDISVRPAWDAGLSGQGVTVAIVDQGTQYRHPDLEANWVIGSGYDFRDDDSDPSPVHSDESHGTAVAGITLAASNALGGIGVAHKAGLVPVRLIGTKLSGYGIASGVIPEALAYRRSSVDIYNNSWGPSSEAQASYQGIGESTRAALQLGIQQGRGGRGNIFVWAAGNGAENGHNTNYSGYRTLPYSISVGAVGHDDIKAGYSVPGAGLLVVAPSGGRGQGILTTDNTDDTAATGYAEGDVYAHFSGTSAAAPVVSGVVALLLESRPDLGWRDVQQILALTAVPVDFNGGDWERNAAGRWVSHDYGFGRVDAAAALRLAADWPLLPPLQVEEASSFSSSWLSQGTQVSRTLNLPANLRIQFVQLRLSSNHSNWGDLRVELVSPQGTSSLLAEPHGSASGNVGTWTYLSNRHVGELSAGAWTLRITDDGPHGSGSLLGWTVVVWGTDPSMHPNRSPLGEDLLIESTEFPVEIDLLAGMTDPDGDPLEVLAVQQPQAGTLESVGDGRVRFFMGNTRTGMETFSVLFGDGRGEVRRRLIQVFDPRPVAFNDVFPVVGQTVTDLPVLDNDRDPDGAPLRVVALSQPRAGSVSVAEGGLVRYAAPPGFSGVDRFNYTMTDDKDGEASAWVTVVVQEEPDIVLEFDGEDDFMRLPPNADLSLADDFTAEAWIYPTGWGEYVTGFGRIYDRGAFIFFLNGLEHAFYNDRSLVAYFILDDDEAIAANSAPGTIRLNEWQHVAVSFNSATATPVRFYVNGLPVGHSYPLEGTSAPRRPLRDNRQNPLYMGEAPSAARAFAGRMHDFRIWDRALDGQTIAARRGQRLTGDEPDLLLHFPLEGSLAPAVPSVGRVRGTAELSGARRVPRVTPWDAFGIRYALVEDAGNGWWRDRTLGWIYGDLYPWVYLPALDWAYSGHAVADDRYFLHPAESDWGWLWTRPGLYPWFHHYASGSWLWYLQGTQAPGLFYESGSGGWIPAGAGFPDN